MINIRVLIADDHALVRSGFRALLAAQSDLEVVGEATDGVEVVEVCRKLAPNVVLMDLTMPGRSGIRAIEDLRQTCPDVKVLVVTMHEDETYARQALLAGASGYVLKKSLETELITAIRAVSRGEKHITPALARTLSESEQSTELPDSSGSRLELLTPREREVASHIALGYTNLEIARRLFITEKTVETHRMHIMSKLNLRTRADVVRFALNYGLIGA